MSDVILTMFGWFTLGCAIYISLNKVTGEFESYKVGLYNAFETVYKALG